MHQAIGIDADDDGVGDKVFDLSRQILSERASLLRHQDLLCRFRTV